MGQTKVYAVDKAKIKEGYKECSKCKTQKKVDNFYSDKRAKDGFHSWCKDCNSGRKKERYKENPELKILAQERCKRWYRKNRNSNIKYNYKYRRDNQERVLFNAARYRARKSGIDFSIDICDVFIPEFCPILGVKLFKGTVENKDSSPSLDKIDNSVGYVKGNVRVISNLANQMKSRATKDQLIKFAENIDDYISS